MLSDLLSFFLQHIFKYRKEVIRKNLNLVFPKLSDKEKKIIERKAYKHLCDLFLETIKSLGMSKEDMTKRFIFKNIDVIKEFENDPAWHAKQIEGELIKIGKKSLGIR